MYFSSLSRFLKAEASIWEGEKVTFRCLTQLCSREKLELQQLQIPHKQWAKFWFTSAGRMSAFCLTPACMRMRLLFLIPDLIGHASIQGLAMICYCHKVSQNNQVPWASTEINAMKSFHSIILMNISNYTSKMYIMHCYTLCQCKHFIRFWGWNVSIALKRTVHVCPCCAQRRTTNT